MVIKRIFQVLLALAGIGCIYICCTMGWLLFGMYIWNDFQMRRAIKPPSSTSYLFEVQQPVLTNTDQMTMYYASSEPLDAVKATYEKMGVVFLAGTSEKDWWVGAYNQTGFPQPYPAGSPGSILSATDKSFCDATHLMNYGDEGFRSLGSGTTMTVSPQNLDATRTFQFGCIAVTLIKADHPNLCTLDAIYPADERVPYGTVTPVKRCSQLPRQGTIIVYNYYLT